MRLLKYDYTVDVVHIRRAEWTEQPRQHQHTKRRYVSTVTVNNFEGTIVIFEQRHIAESELNYKGFKTHGTVVGQGGSQLYD